MLKINNIKKNLFMNKTFRRMAFTMAEILLSMTIIAVISVLTLPTLKGNINERTWNTQRKALYSRISQAVALMPSINGFEIENVDAAANTFLTSGLAKVFKINNICDYDHITDCGFPNKINTSASKDYDVPQDWESLNPAMTSMVYTVGLNFSHSLPNYKAVAFETSNGESILLYYNPRCIAPQYDLALSFMVQPSICANLLFDLNGRRGPNTINRDIGVITVLYATDSVVVAPVITGFGEEKVLRNDAVTYCRGISGARLPSFEEAIAIYINKNIFGFVEERSFFTSRQDIHPMDNLLHPRHMDMGLGIIGFYSLDRALKPLCIKRH